MFRQKAVTNEDQSKCACHISRKSYIVEQDAFSIKGALEEDWEGIHKRKLIFVKQIWIISDLKIFSLSSKFQRVRPTCVKITCVLKLFLGSARL